MKATRQEFYNAAIRIAESKMSEQKSARPFEGSRIKPWIPTGGHFYQLFLWDTVFCIMWAKHEPERFPIFDSLDNFYILQEQDGFIGREYLPDGRPCWTREHPVSFAPPLFSWAELELYNCGLSNTDRLKKILPILVKHHEFDWKTYRREDGLFFGDALGCGMDDLPRTPRDGVFDSDAGIQMNSGRLLNPDSLPWFKEKIEGKPLYNWNRQAGWIDMSAQMAFNALNISKIAAITGDVSTAAEFEQMHSEMSAIINGKCWDEKLGFYFDYYNGSVIPRFHAGAFWTLIAGIVPPIRVKRMVECFRDSSKFARPVPVPVLSADDPDYDPEKGYWRGAVWPCTTYALLRGLRECGENSLAHEIAEKTYAGALALYENTGTIWENMSSEQIDHQKDWSAPDFCGWGALIPVAVYKEYLL